MAGEVSVPELNDAAAALHVESAGAGPRVALVHGFTQSGASWASVAAELSAGHEVLLPDLPGHGGSPAATGDLGTAAVQLAAACGRATYVGYSLGGRVCLRLALDRPEFVDRLVLVSTTAGIEDLDAREERMEQDAALAERIEAAGEAGLSAFIDEWLAGPLFAHLPEAAADRPARLVNSAARLAGSLRAHGTGTQLPLWERLSELAMPTVVVAGADDRKFVDLGERLAGAAGTGSLFVLAPGAGHAVPFEQPEAFARLVADFVAGRAGAAVTSAGPEHEDGEDSTA